MNIRELKEILKEVPDFYEIIGPYDMKASKEDFEISYANCEFTIMGAVCDDCTKESDWNCPGTDSCGVAQHACANAFNCDNYEEY